MRAANCCDALLSGGIVAIRRRTSGCLITHAITACVASVAMPCRRYAAVTPQPISTVAFASGGPFRLIEPITRFSARSTIRRKRHGTADGSTRNARRCHGMPSMACGSCGHPSGISTPSSLPARPYSCATSNSSVSGDAGINDNRDVSRMSTKSRAAILGAERLGAAPVYAIETMASVLRSSCLTLERVVRRRPVQPVVYSQSFFSISSSIL